MVVLLHPLSYLLRVTPGAAIGWQVSRGALCVLVSLCMARFLSRPGGHNHQKPSSKKQHTTKWRDKSQPPHTSKYKQVQAAAKQQRGHQHDPRGHTEQAVLQR